MTDEQRAIAEAVARANQPCTMGYGCDEAGVCYASAHDQPERCPKSGGEFEREERYIVVKRKNLDALDERLLRELLGELSIPIVDCAVVEADWPEYEPVWQMIEDRVSGKPSLLSRLAALEAERAAGEARVVDEIAAMMSEFVDNWPPHKKVSTSLALIAKTMQAALDARAMELEAALATAGPIHAGPIPGNLGQKFPKARQCVIEYEAGDGAYDLHSALVTLRAALTKQEPGT